MPNIRLTIEYDGTAYHGWQRQASVPAIQHAIESAIARISRESVTVIGSGRTDAGVHALAQTANFHTRATLEPAAWQRALNAVLPDDIAVIAAEAVDESFHARFSARGKRYRYFVMNRPSPSPLVRRSAWHLFRPLNLARMRRGAAFLIGSHDFSAFRAADHAHRPSDDTVCRLTRCAIRATETWYSSISRAIASEIHGRNIVGTLVQVGMGARDSSNPGDPGRERPNPRRPHRPRRVDADGGCLQRGAPSHRPVTRRYTE
jgi:tRNA pseudouridine38-40 synthase